MNSEDESTEETLSTESDSDFDSVLGDAKAQLEEDRDATHVQVTRRPVPGYQEVRGDIFRIREQKRKGFAYALGHCISADAAMSAGIAPKFCQHFVELRERVNNEPRERGTLIAVERPEEQCWIYNLVTKEKCYEKPTIEDLEQALLRMREHAIANRV